MENLHNLTKNDKLVELVVHETGPERHLTDEWVKNYNIKYSFSKWDGVFHRAWSLNYAAKHSASGDLFVFMDADLIVDKKWLLEVKKCENISIGWSEMVNLNHKGTEKFLSGKISLITDFDIERVRKPSPYAAAGGINIFPKDIFFDIKGWCEDYYGTYGGEDNSTLLKLTNFGYVNDIINAKVFHLHHAHTTLKSKKRFEIFNKHKEFTAKMWKDYVNKIKTWGDETYELENKENILKVLWCKMDTTGRVAGHFDDLLASMTRECHVDILTQPLQGYHPAIFQQGCLNRTIRRNEIVKEHLDANPDYDFIICADIFAFNNEKWCDIKIPKAAMFEDQHGDNNLSQVKDMVKDNWLVLHRYQFRKFHTDLHKYLKCIWFPHSVNTKIFRDYNMERKYDILQTGALYKVYETRNFVKSVFSGDERYKIIERPKENVPNQWPTRKDYAKELNKAYLNVCCGSVYQYPVMKYFEIPAAKSVIFGDWFDELGDLGFEPYNNMLVIDRDNIKKQVDFLLDNKKRLIEIANNGHNLVYRRHTNEIRAKELIDIIKDEICQHQCRNH